MIDTTLDSRLAAFAAKNERLCALGFDRLAACAFVAQAGRPFFGPVLDVGTGRGLFAIAMAKLGAAVTSVDADASDLALAVHLAAEAQVGERIHFESADAERLPFRAASFQTVAMMDVLHHLENPEAVFAEMARVLAPDGQLLIADFDAEGFALLDRVGREEGKPHDRLPVSVDFAARWFEAKGFATRLRRSGQRHDLVVLARVPQVSGHKEE